MSDQSLDLDELKPERVGPMGYRPSVVQIILAEQYQASLAEVKVDGVTCYQIIGRLVYGWGTYVWPESPPMAPLPGWWP